jgi:phosphomannomutase
MPIIRSISGLRATISDNCLSVQLIINYAIAFHQFCPNGLIIIGRDGRPSGGKIEQILFSTFTHFGREVKLIGIVPSPTVQLITELENAAGGISITASHNPDDWNGLKFINSKGIFLDEFENARLWELLEGINNSPLEGFQAKIFEKGFCEETLYSAKQDGVDEFNQSLRTPPAPSFQEGGMQISFADAQNDIPEYRQINSDVHRTHIESILKLPYLSGSLDFLKERKLKVVVDAVNASGSVIVPSLLEQSGCDVIRLFCDSTGVFPHLPEPLPINLNELAKAVKNEIADIGISVDPDADRLVLIDETGEPIGEENTIVFAVQSVMSYAKENHLEMNLTAVVNHSTTQGVEFIAGKYGGRVERSSVGEINVVKKMITTGAVIGGEGSGGVILPECHYGRDSLVGIALILSLIARSGKSLRELRDEIPNYSMIKDKFHFEGDFSDLSVKVKSIFENCQIIEEDGMKFIFTDSWLQIRKSNTEPIVRIIAEGVNPDEIAELISKVKNAVS